MPSNALYLKAPHLYCFARISSLVFIFEDVIPTVLVVAGISLQRILVVFIQRNDYIPFESRAITLDNKQIVLIDSGIHHGIAFGTENVEISFAKHRDREADILLNRLFLILRIASANRTY